MVAIGAVTGRIYADMFNSTTALDKLKEAGTRFIRMEFEERFTGNPTLSATYDKILSDCQQRGIKVLGVLGVNSCRFRDWSDQDWAFCRPRNFVRWTQAQSDKYIAGYIETTMWHMQHYTSVTDWEIWNEPDQYEFKDHEDDYALLLKRVFEWAREKRRTGVIPAATRIFSAGVVNQDETVMRRIWDTTPVNDFRNVNNHDIPCDVFCYHPYGQGLSDGNPNTGKFNWGLTFEQSFNDARNRKTIYYKRNGVATSVPLIPLNKPVCLSEFGFNSQTVGLQQQADWTKSMVEVMKRYPIIERAFVYDFQDDKPNATSEGKKNGLFDVNMNAKPAWTHYKSFPK